MGTGALADASMLAVDAEGGRREGAGREEGGRREGAGREEGAEGREVGIAGGIEEDMIEGWISGDTDATDERTDEMKGEGGAGEERAEGAT